MRVGSPRYAPPFSSIVRGPVNTAGVWVGPTPPHAALDELLRRENYTLSGPYRIFIFYSSLVPSGPGLHDNTQKRHTREDFSGRVIGPSQRLPPDNTQHSTSMAPVRFEPIIPENERLQAETLRGANRIGHKSFLVGIKPTN